MVWYGDENIRRGCEAFGKVMSRQGTEKSCLI